MLSGLVLLLGALATGQAAEDVSKFPSRAITYINPTAPGNPTSMAVRLMAQEAEKILGRPVIEVNKPGAASTLGIGILASSKPDGYTVGYGAHSGFYVAPFLEKVSYNPVRDLTPLLQFGSFNFALGVKGDSPYKTFQDLIAYARKNPKKVAYGTNGATSLQYIIMEQIARREKVEMIHIPFSGTAEYQTALLGGHIQFGAGDFTESLVESGQVRFLALFKDEKSAEYPNVPILKELGYDIPCPITQNIFAPKRIPPEIAKKLEDAFTKAMKQPAFVAGMKKLRLPIVYRNSKDLGEYVARNFELYAKYLKDMGLAQ